VTRPATPHVFAHPNHARAHRHLTAAHHATLAYPGPVGQLLAREIRSWVDFGHHLGHHLGDHGVMAGVVEQVLAQPEVP